MNHLALQHLALQKVLKKGEIGFNDFTCGVEEVRPRYLMLIARLDFNKNVIKLGYYMSLHAHLEKEVMRHINAVLETTCGAQEVKHCKAHQ
mmetsp:Transcript_19978/g.49836  ORF Transcript_19978/g.49836 Transcript_19978/m.49836 type:complete len:91 (+) Transcript_19978:413-685(+)